MLKMADSYKKSIWHKLSLTREAEFPESFRREQLLVAESGGPATFSVQVTQQAHMRRIIRYLNKNTFPRQPGLLC